MRNGHVGKMTILHDLFEAMQKIQETNILHCSTQFIICIHFIPLNVVLLKETFQLREQSGNPSSGIHSDLICLRLIECSWYNIEFMT